MVLVAADAAPAQNRIGDRDQHYNTGKGRVQSPYDYYQPPRVYYPRRPQDVVKPVPVPAPRMRVPGGPDAPAYGAPPAAIDRIPKT